MKDKSLMLGLLLCTLAVNASAQQQNGNPLGQIFNQLGAGQSGSPLLMKPAGTNPSATLNVMFFVKKSPVMVNVCEFYAQIQNPSNVHVDLGQMPVTYKNKYGQPVQTSLEVHEVAPGQMKIVQIPIMEGIGECGSVTGVLVHGGGASQWPNSCLIQNSPARPCPVSINATGQNISVQYR